MESVHRASSTPHALTSSVFSLNSKEAWPSKATRMQVHFQPSSQPSSTPPTESTELLPTSPPPVVQPRQRNLLRKRSASKQIRASVSATLPGKATTSSALQPATRSSAAASSRISAPPHGSSSKLTPASAIAQAYKEQDLRREALAAAARAENLSTIVPASGSRLCLPDTPTSAASATSTVGKGKSYCTVLETSPDRIVLVGSVEDNSYDAVDAPSSGSHSAPASSSVGQPIRSLTRKVSARFRRGKPVVTRDSSTQSVHEDRGDGELPLSGDPSRRHERLQSASYPKVKGKLDSLRLSLDQRNVVVPSGESLDGHDHRPVPSESIPDVVGPSPPQSKGKHKPQEDDTGAGGRLWRLVKRISAGGLRERFYATGAPVPPVPAIPPDLVPSRATLEVKMPVTPNRTSGSGGAEPGGGDHKGPTVGHSMDPSPSTSAVWPNADDRSDMTCTTLTGVPATPQNPGTVSQPRLPSISSSSPRSSEPTSTHFFRSHSSRSSFSSIFCGSPPLPPVSVLAQSPAPRTRSRTKSSSSSPALPPSNDESPQTSSVRTRKRSSPDMPTFSVSAVVNNFIARRPSLTRRQPQNASARSTTPHPEETNAPPPRPARSDLSNAVGREERVHPLLSPGLSVQSRDSHSSSSTERPGSASTSTISAHAVAGTSARTGPVTRMTFRELGGTRRQAWTSQEKEDKWDDLLEKSAQAGGTLHLDAENAGLPSDNIRFSSGTLESEVSRSS
ncbi:hypothetical protein EDB83DRAFT_2362174 [Lactarius deliciosus]|nr:hypothetical protein EDB83DRAFT_2362174 [Lactarius deliciosus]